MALRVRVEGPRNALKDLGERLDFFLRLFASKASRRSEERTCRSTHAPSLLRAKEPVDDFVSLLDHRFEGRAADLGASREDLGCEVERFALRVDFGGGEVTIDSLEEAGKRDASARPWCEATKGTHSLKSTKVAPIT